jgi:acyl-CoA dehydrogenase
LDTILVRATARQLALLLVTAKQLELVRATARQLELVRATARQLDLLGATASQPDLLEATASQPDLLEAAEGHRGLVDFYGQTHDREEHGGFMVDYEELDSAVGVNWYETDPNLQLIVDRLVDEADRDWAHEKLQQFGELCGGPIASRAEVTDKNPPRLVKYDRWGEEIDEIIHHPGAVETKRDLHSYFVSLSFSEAARGRTAGVPTTVGTAFSYLLSQAETGMLCAVGMTGGAAALIEAWGGPEAKQYLLPHMTSENFEEFWDGAMFMTERAGGSDVGATETVATHLDGERWLLNGFKWFCSNLDAKVIVTLARPEGAPSGVYGLALFAVPQIKRDGTRNGLVIHRLKDKLGTKAVPTGEVEFVNAEAYLLAGGRSENADPERMALDGQGLVRMMSMVNGSRHGVALMGLGIARRCFLESAVYAFHREAFGTKIKNFPLIRETLVRMLMEIEGCAAMIFEAAKSLERQERGLWRILVPLGKYRATRRGLQIASAAVEVLGGNGYIEDWPTARQLRDAQCHTIWEGTENIICLDVRRAATREGAHVHLFERLEKCLEVSGADAPVLKDARSTIASAQQDARKAVDLVLSAPKDVAQLHTRRLARALADVSQASFLFEEAAWEFTNKGSARKAALVQLFVDTRLRPRRLWGIESDNRICLDLFEPIVKYEPISEDQVLAAVGS